jgi:methenyltetrahydromethanopterin cyclohydrolase
MSRRPPLAVVPLNLNHRAARRCAALVDAADELRVAVLCSEGGARIVDCGVNVPGGLEAGRALAEICMAGLGRVEFTSADPSLWQGPAVEVWTDQPVAACMAAQYAGWPVAGERFFAMGSGPMRAAAGKEAIFDTIGHRERPRDAVGVLESGKFPPADVCEHVAHACGVSPERLTLLVAPTASQAGSVQIAARTVETALHKLHELGYDLSRVESGYGVAPLPPVAANDLAAIGRTNDAVLYGGQVTLYVRDDQTDWPNFGPRVPSSGSPDHGEPFAAIFERHGRDFYKVDPLIFSPAVVTIVQLDTGKVFRFGRAMPEVLRRSFEG